MSYLVKFGYCFGVHETEMVRIKMCFVNEI